MKKKINEELSHTKQAMTAASDTRQLIPDLAAAITHVTGLPGFAAMHAVLCAETEPILKELEAFPNGHPLGLSWLDKHAEHLLSLVHDLASWDSYRIILNESYCRTAYIFLFGGLNVEPACRSAWDLEAQLRQRIRYWQQKSSEKLAACQNQHAPTHLARNLTTLCSECGWSHGKLADQIGVEKKIVISHIVHGKNAHPKTLLKYAQAFTDFLHRKVTPVDLLAA